MFSLEEAFGTNKSYEENGVRIDLGDGAEIVVARFGSKRYKDYFGKITKKYHTQLRTKTLSEEKSQELLIDAMARTILLDWTNMSFDGKTMLPYSYENAKEALTKYRDFRDLVDMLSKEQETFREISQEEDIKNSEMLSPGSSDGESS